MQTCGSCQYFLVVYIICVRIHIPSPVRGFLQSAFISDIGSRLLLSRIRNENVGKNKRVSKARQVTIDQHRFRHTASERLVSQDICATVSWKSQLMNKLMTL